MIFRIHKYFFSLSIYFLPLLTQEATHDSNELQTIILEWRDDIRDERLMFQWCPLKHLHGNKKPLLLIKTNERGTFYFFISSENLRDWQRERDVEGDFVRRMKLARASLEQSVLKSFLFSKKLRELDALDIGFEGYKIEPDHFNTFFDKIKNVREKIDTDKKNYKKKYPKHAALGTQFVINKIAEN